MFTLIYAKDAIEFEKILMDNQKYLLDEIQSLFDRQMIELVYKNGKNHDLSSSINQLIGYTLDLQIDYQVTGRLFHKLFHFLENHLMRLTD